MDTFVERMFGKKVGEVASINPDYIVINDGPSHFAVSEIRSVANPEKILVIYDHDVPTGSPKAAEILKNNLAFANKYGCSYIQSKGVGYQYLLKEVVKEKDIIIGGGSHASIFGSIGALGINVSTPELARIVESGKYSVIVMETLCYTLEMDNKDNFDVMDIALQVLRKYRGAWKNKALEFYLPNWSEEDAAIFCSMMGLSEAYTAVLSKTPLKNAELIHLDRIEPMLMLPCESREKQRETEIVELNKKAGIELQAGQIGGYTGGTIKQLRKAANLIAGQRLARGFRLSICPATSEDYLLAMDEGILEAFIDFGAQIHAVGDRSVVASGAGAMGPNENLITTGLYTFAGCMGAESANVYTASVSSVIAAAISKKI